MDNDYSNLNEMQIDTIREISNIGMGHAATALSQMLSQQVEIAVPKAVIGEVVDAPQLMGGEEAEVAASYVQVMGQARGHLMMVFDLDGAQKLIGLMAPGMDISLKDGNEMAISAIQEVGNILSSSFLRSLADMTGLTLLPTVPAVAIDFAGSIVTYVVSSMYEITEKLVFVQTNFEVGGETIGGHCVFIPEPGSLSIILTSLGVGE